RQFGVMTAAAFLLALVADLTALPAALWIASGERPGAAGGPSSAAPPAAAGRATTPAGKRA
ncbi:MAG: hypothetical protein ACJ79L_19445, partial [Anaeromyxobacteraceae bacterium]